MQEAVGWHRRSSPFFRKLLDSRRFSPVSCSKKFEESLPFVHVNYFKKRKLLSVPEEKVSLHLTSSGTTGQKSRVFFDERSIARGALRMVERIFAHYGWITPDVPANYLMFTYETGQEEGLGTAYTDHHLCRFAPVNRVEVAIKKLRNPDGFRFDLFGVCRALQEFAEEGLPVRIFGFPSYLCFCLKYWERMNLPPLRLDPRSLIFLGGGWKDHADQEISKDRLRALAEKHFGIPEHRIRDGYGSVEHCVPYVECEKHHLHVPVWSKAMIRSVSDLRVLPYGECGYLQFMSPYITSMPAINVLMNDLAVLRPAAACECTLETDWFGHRGRAGLSKARSCAVAAGDLLKGF